MTPVEHEQAGPDRVLLVARLLVTAGILVLVAEARRTAPEVFGSVVALVVAHWLPPAREMAQELMGKSRAR